MYHHYGFPVPATYTPLPMQDMADRLDFIEEEFEETILAYAKKDDEEIIDGLIDIIVVALGTLTLMGCNTQAHWDEVLRANMDKIVGKKKGREMKHDLTKPDDWIPPRHDLILEDQ